MNPRQVVALVGAALLLFGAFAPLVSVPIAGNMTYVQNGRGDGMIIIGMAALTAVVALMRIYGALWFTGLVSAATMAYTFFSFRSKISEMQADMKSQLAGNPFAGIAEAAMNSIQMQWGWAVLVLGAVLVLIAAAMREKAPKSADCPHCDGVVPINQQSCNHCGNAITWIAGKARKPSRAAAA